MADRENPFGQSVAQGSTLMTQNVNAPIGAFGGLTAAALSRGGQDMQQAGAQVVNFAQRLKQRRSASDIMGAMTQAQKAMQDAWYDPENGFARRTGLSADGLHEDVSATVDRIGREAMANIRDKDAQELFMQRWGVEGIQHMGKAAEWEMHQLDNGHTDQVNDWAAVLQADIEADPSITPEEISKHLAEAETFISGVFDGNETGKQLAEKVKGKLVASSIIGMVNANDYDTATKTLGNKEMQKLLAVGGFDVGKMTQSVESKRQEYQSFELGKQMVGMSIDKKLEMTRHLDTQSQQRALNIANAIESARKEAHEDEQLSLNRSLLGAVADYKKELETTKTLKTSSEIFIGDLAKQYEALDGDHQLRLMYEIDRINGTAGGGKGSASDQQERTAQRNDAMRQLSLLATSESAADRALYVEMTSSKSLNTPNENLPGLPYLTDDDIDKLKRWRSDLNSGKMVTFDQLGDDAQAAVIVGRVMPNVKENLQSPQFSVTPLADNVTSALTSRVQNDLTNYALQYKQIHKSWPTTQEMEEAKQSSMAVNAYAVLKNDNTEAMLKSQHMEEFGGSVDLLKGASPDRVGRWNVFMQDYLNWEEHSKTHGLSSEEVGKAFLLWERMIADNPNVEMETVVTGMRSQRRTAGDDMSAWDRVAPFVLPGQFNPLLGPAEYTSAAAPTQEQLLGEFVDNKYPMNDAGMAKAIAQAEADVEAMNRLPDMVVGQRSAEEKKIEARGIKAERLLDKLKKSKRAKEGQ